MKPINLKGKKFSRLTVLEYDIKSKGTGHGHWICRCICGKIKSVRASHLKKNNVTSCGCYASERASKWLKFYTNSDRHKGKGNPSYLHGQSKTDLFKIYQGINSRTLYNSSFRYKHYAKRGIGSSWKDFFSFKKDMEKSYIRHILKYGKRNTTIDRINVNGDYSKENCRWATYKEQGNNRRNNVLYTYKGQTKTMKQWSELSNVSYSAFQKRLKKMSFKKAFEEPMYRNKE